jgi:hypothetical protein
MLVKNKLSRGVRKMNLSQKTKDNEKGFTVLTANYKHVFKRVNEQEYDFQAISRADGQIKAYSTMPIQDIERNLKSYPFSESKVVPMI